MTGIYYTGIDSVLRGAGLTVQENQYNKGWQTRARSSGGFPSTPLAVFWHHTASKTSVENDLAWQCQNCPDKPVGNMLIDRKGIVWLVAAGASNCAGKGGPATFSRGTIPLDTGNTRGWQIEVANNGVGEPWPECQIDSYFTASNALNAFFGNLPTDVITHQAWAPTRKIDPATADAVMSPWQPRGINSSGTWHLDDIKAECQRRAKPAPTNGDDMVDGIYQPNGPARYLCFTSGTKLWITDDGMLDGAQRLCRMWGRPDATHDASKDLGYFAALGLVTGPRPEGTDEWGSFV